MLSHIVDLIARMRPVLCKVKDDIDNTGRQLLALCEHDTCDDHVDGAEIKGFIAACLFRIAIAAKDQVVHGVAYALDGILGGDVSHDEVGDDKEPDVEEHVYLESFALAQENKVLMLKK